MTVTNKINALILIACIVSDGTCLVPQKAEEQPFGTQHSHVKLDERQFTATATVNIDSCTICGKQP